MGNLYFMELEYLKSFEYREFKGKDIPNNLSQNEWFELNFTKWLMNKH